MAFYVIKVVISAVFIVLISEISRRNTTSAQFVGIQEPFPAFFLEKRDTNRWVFDVNDLHDIDANVDARFDQLQVPVAVRIR
jgi:hypothetical protein